MSTDASIASLIDLTALSAEQASTLLAAAGGDLDLAVALHFDDTTLPFLPAAEPPPPAVEELSDGFGLFSLLDGVDDDGPDAPASAPAAAAAARPPRRRRGNKGGAGRANPRQWHPDDDDDDFDVLAAFEPGDELLAAEPVTHHPRSRRRQIPGGGRRRDRTEDVAGSADSSSADEGFGGGSLPMAIPGSSLGAGGSRRTRGGGGGAGSSGAQHSTSLPVDVSGSSPGARFGSPPAALLGTTPPSADGASGRGGRRRGDSGDLRPSPSSEGRRGSGSGGKERGGGGDRTQAERAISRLTWDARFDASRDAVVVHWLREEKVETRKSGAAAWSSRLRHVPASMPLSAFLRDRERQQSGGGGGGGGDEAGTSAAAAPPYHLVNELSLNGETIWSAKWGTSRLAGGVGASPPLRGYDPSPPGDASGLDGFVLGGGGGAAAAAMAAAAPAAAGAAVSELPEELWSVVLSHLETEQLCVMAAVAKPLRALCNDRSLWAAEHVRVFGEAAADGADAAYLQRLLRRSEGAMEGWRQRPADENDLEFTGHVHGEGWGGGGGGEGGRRRAKEEGAVRALAAHDGLVASADGACVRLWSVEGRKRILTLKAQNGRAELHGGGVTCLDIDADQLLSGGGDGALHIYDLAEDEISASIRGIAAGAVSDCLLLRGSARARAVSSDTTGCVRLWDAAGGEVAELLRSRDAPLCPVPLAVRGETLLVARGREAVLFDMRAERELSRVTLGDPGCAVACCFGGDMTESWPGVGSPVFYTSQTDSGSIACYDARMLVGAAQFNSSGAGSTPVGELPLLHSTADAGFSAAPPGAAFRNADCARKLSSDGARLFAAVDDEPALAFARAATSIALYDVRRMAAAGEGTHPSAPLLWQREVRGGLSCFAHARGGGLIVGTCAGGIAAWNCRPPTIDEAAADDDERGGGGRTLPKREKKKSANPKIRGRFPKRQGP